ncbi:MAG: hypothetical protein AAFU72_15290 [Pseudomonadota bacterium]
MQITHLAPLAVALMLAACASDQEFARQLAGEGPNAIDPAGVTVAVQPPRGLAIPSNGARLTLAAEDTTGWAVSEEFVLVIDADAEAPGLPADEGVTALSLAPSDMARFRETARMVGRRELDAPEDVRGSFSASVDPCLVDERIAPSGPLLVYLRFAEDRPYRLLRREADFVDQLNRARGAANALPRCPSPGG